MFEPHLDIDCKQEDLIEQFKCPGGSGRVQIDHRSPERILRRQLGHDFRQSLLAQVGPGEYLGNLRPEDRRSRSHEGGNRQFVKFANTSCIGSNLKTGQSGPARICARWPDFAE